MEFKSVDNYIMSKIEKCETLEKENEELKEGAIDWGAKKVRKDLQEYYDKEVKKQMKGNE